MPRRPQHGCAVLLVERIARINEEKPPVLLLGVLLPQNLHRVDLPFEPCIQATAELLCPSGVTTKTHFANIRRQVSPTPTGLTPGHFLRTIRCPNISAL